MVQRRPAGTQEEAAVYIKGANGPIETSLVPR
jgi:hypothetical protein